MRTSLKILGIVMLILIPSITIFWFLGHIVSFFFAVPWTLFLLFLTNLDKAFGVLASLYEYGSGISFWFEKNAVGKRIESSIAVTSKHVNQEVQDLLPHGVKVKWVEKMDRETFLQDDKVIVCFESSTNQDRNIARATALYVNHDLIRKSQRFVNPTIMKSAAISIARKMLMIEKRFDALARHADEFVNPAIEENPLIQEYIETMQDMDDQGVLTRILLREFSHLDARIGTRASYPQAEQETKEFTDMLKVFVEREPTELVQLRLTGNVINANLVPIALSAREFSTAFYISKSFQAHEIGIDTLYVMARRFNLGKAKRVVAGIVRAKLYDLRDESEFVIRTRNENITTYIAMMVKSVGEPDPKSIAFETLRNVVLSMKDEGKTAIYSTVASKFKEKGFDYRELGYKKFGALVKDAAKADYILLKEEENGTPSIDAV